MFRMHFISFFLLIILVAVSYLSKYLRLSDRWQLNPALAEDCIMLVVMREALQIPTECGQCIEVNLIPPDNMKKILHVLLHLQGLMPEGNYLCQYY